MTTIEQLAADCGGLSARHLRSVFPMPAVDTEPLEELILDDSAYASGKAAKELGGPRVAPMGWSPTGHQCRSWFKGYDNATVGTPEPAAVGGGSTDASGGDESEVE